MSRPLRNRVTPRGEIVATPERGLLMGNRGGRLHDGCGGLLRHQAGRAWLICRLDGGPPRAVLREAGWTALFFLDEATALAAGHRPCACCRRPAFRAFAAAWARALPGPPPRAPAIDGALAAARRAPRPLVPAGSLPDGAMIEAESAAWLVLAGTLRAWSPAGYGPRRPLPATPVRLLTPEPSVAVLRAGYTPLLHPTAH